MYRTSFLTLHPFRSDQPQPIYTLLFLALGAAILISSLCGLLFTLANTRVSSKPSRSTLLCCGAAADALRDQPLELRAYLDDKYLTISHL